MEGEASDNEEFQARVLWDFTPDESGELQVTAGQQVTVLKDVEPWSLVRDTRGNEGYVPTNYLEQLDTKPSAPPPPPARGNGRRAGGGIQNRIQQYNQPNTYAPDDPPTPVAAPPAKTPFGFRPKQDEQNSYTQRAVKRERRDTTSMDSSIAYNLFASGTEWWACLCLFFSGVFTVMWGSLQSPEDQGMEALGSIQCIEAGVLLVYFALFRETCCFCSEGCQEKTSLLRMGILVAATIPCWPAYPMGWIGLAALIIAACANLLVYVKEGKVLEDEGVEVQWLTMNINFLQAFGLDGSKTGVKKFCFCNVALISLAIMVFLNILFYKIGEELGDDRIAEEADRDQARELGEAYSMAEGFGTIISMNIVLLFLSSLKGLQLWVKERVRLHKGESDCKDRFLNMLSWFFEDERQIFFHRIFAAAIAIASVGHISTNFLAYEDSGPANDYYEIFGAETVVTGFCLIVFLIPIFSATNPKIKTLNSTLFKWTHMCWVPVVMLCLFHGKGGWNTHFWKFLIGPLIIYLFDLLYLRGIDNMIEAFRRERGQE